MKNKILGYIRRKIGSYCNDGYWYNTIDSIWANQAHPVLWVKNHLSYLAINAIATDMTYRNG